MPQSISGIAEAFSRHRFPEAIPHLSDDVAWSLVGAATISGRDAVAAACDATSSELRDATVVFTGFRVIVGQDSVVVDSVGEYADAEGGRSVVASCDIYDFTDGLVTAIRSYNVELE